MGPAALSCAARFEVDLISSYSKNGAWPLSPARE
jgi:hypothetical protein